MNCSGRHTQNEQISGIDEHRPAGFFSR